MTFDTIVIGAGAAGLMCALEAGRRGRRVLVVESNEAAGKKILISGGGRCNFTNLYASPENYLSSNPHFARSALARYTPEDFVALVESYGITYHEKKLGQLFCDGNARQIVDMLLSECDASGVELRVGCEVRSVEHDGHFVVETNLGTFESETLVVACGGLSIPKIGATDFGYKLARQFGLKVVQPRPGLVPLTFAGDELGLFESLSGVSVDAVVSAGSMSFRENLLFTHRGLSGPAVLQASSYWQPGESLTVDLLPDADALAWLTSAREEPRDLWTLLGEAMPRRVALGWCDLYTPFKPLSRYSNRELEDVARRLQSWSITPAGTLGFAKAEVTTGGVDTRELSSRTMEASKAPGLFFVGEVVDVTGWLGGYNFQWAWASGVAAGAVA